MSSIKIFQVGLLHLISLQYRLSFTDFSLGDVDLCFSLKLERKANADEEETIWAVWLHHQCNQSIHMSDDMSVASLSASILQKTSEATDHPWQSTLNWKLSHNLKTGVNFQSALEQNHANNKLCTTRPACTRCSDHQFYSVCVFGKSVDTMKISDFIKKWIYRFTGALNFFPK
jgi:hypothetical protein